MSRLEKTQQTCCGVKSLISFFCMKRICLNRNALISVRIQNIHGIMMSLLLQVGLMLLFDFLLSHFSSFSTAHHHCFGLPLSSSALTCFHLFSQMTSGRPALISPSVYTCYWTYHWTERLYVSLPRFTAQRQSPLGTVAHPFVSCCFVQYC